MKNTITATRAISEFKKVIVPGIFKTTFTKAMKDNALMVKVGCVFAQYSNDLEARGFITPKVAQEMDLKFVAILQNSQK